MIRKRDFKRIGEYLWEIPQTFRQDMRVPARIYADDELLEATLAERSAEQLVNTATLPGIVEYALAMPGIHQGYGFPIGGVAATRLPHGIISPGGVGYDINCGVRLLGTHMTHEEVAPHVGELATALYQNPLPNNSPIEVSSRILSMIQNASVVVMNYVHHQV